MTILSVRPDVSKPDRFLRNLLRTLLHWRSHQPRAVSFPTINTDTEKIRTSEVAATLAPDDLKSWNDGNRSLKNMQLLTMLSLNVYIYLLAWVKYGMEKDH